MRLQLDPLSPSGVSIAPQVQTVKQSNGYVTNNIRGLITAGSNVTIAGSGTEGSPYQISAGDMDVAATWGSITGTLSSQTDLQTALDAKANDSVVFKLTGNQTVTSGVKQFNDAVNFSHTYPRITGTYDSGSSGLYWRSIYGTRHYFNSTAYIDGATAGTVSLVGDLTVSGSTYVPTLYVTGSNGISSAATTGLLRLSGGTINDGATILLGGSTNGAIPSIGLARIGGTDIIKWSTAGVTLGSLVGLPTATHTLHLPTTNTGISIDNVTGTTNYERVRQYWSGNVFNITSDVGGTGAHRAISLNSGGYSFTVAFSGTNKSTLTTASAIAGAVGFLANHTATTTSGIGYGVSISPTINQSGTAGYTAHLINVTQTSTGSGAKLLSDWQVGGVSQAKIQSDGVFFPKQAVTASAPTYVLGGIYFDTTLNKLRIGGASGWETVTST